MKDKQTKYPQLRFKGFTDPWEQRKLGAITDSFSGGTPTAGKAEYYGGEIPFIRSGEISSDSTELFITDAGLNNSSAKMVGIGDILYALYGATSGETSISRINGAINQAILAIRPTKGDDPYMIVQWLKKQKETIISTYLQGGQGNLSGSIVKDLLITLPKNKDEQAKVGSFFKQLDQTITLHQRKLAKLKELKQGYLQKLFPKNGSKFPQLRFAGFADAWEERKLSEIGKIVTGNTPSTSNKGYYNGDFLFVSPADIQENRYVNKTTTTLTELGFKTGRLVPKGATLFVSIGSTIGKIGQSICDVITNQQINSVISFSDYDDDFIYTSILNSSTKIKQLAATQAVPIINKNEFGKSIIKIPSLEEQQKIGAFFKQLDDTIALHQRKLEKLQELKKGYLQKMFC